MHQSTSSAAPLENLPISQPEPSTLRIAGNAVAFKAVWASAILGGANLNPWLGVWTAAAALLVHLYITDDKGAELRLVVMAALIGFCSDSLFAATGLLEYRSGQPISWLGPVWIFALWLAFGTTLNTAFRWLQGRWVLATVLGAVCGPLSYLAGSRMGAVNVPDPAIALPCIGLAWAVLLPALLSLAASSRTIANDAVQEVSHA